MRRVESKRRSVVRYLGVAALLLGAVTGCQMGPTNSTAISQAKDMPEPFWPKEWVHLFPAKTEVEYTLTDDAQAARTANEQKAAAAAGANRLATTSGAK